MGGFCGVISKEDCVMDLFFGTDYHSHLGTHRGGMAVLGEVGFQRSIHNIQNAPFRSKFEADMTRFSGRVGIGVISDTDPQPLVMYTRLGAFAIVTVGLITNIEDLKRELFETNHAQLQYSTTSGMVGPTEVVSALIATQPSLVEGVRYVQQTVKGAVALLQATGNHPEAEIDKVTTPGGVTIKGLNEMEHAGFTSAVIRGLKAGMKS